MSSESPPQRRAAVGIDGLVGLAGVIVSTSAGRFPAMESFYLSVFGSHLRSRRPGFVSFAWPGNRLTVAVHDRVDGTSRDPARVMANFEVVDIESAFDVLRSLSVRVVRQPSLEKWGGIIGTIADPDGNLVQLLQMPGDQILAETPPSS
jgi:predicted enzyme related to lactoylglutathione lyase